MLNKTMTNRYLEKALTRVGSTGPPALVLGHAAFFAPVAIPRQALRRASGLEHTRCFEGAVMYLRKHGFLEGRPDSVVLSGHVAELVRNRLQPHQAPSYAERVTAAVIEMMPWPDSENTRSHAQLRPHAETCAYWIKDFDLESASAAWMLGTVASIYHREGRLAEAAAFMEHDVAICERAVGRANVDICPVLCNLALIYIDQERFDEADALLQRAVTVAEAARPPQDGDLRHLRAALARVRRHRGDG